MIAVCLPILWFGCLTGNPPSAAMGAVYEPAYCLEDIWIGAARPYVPQPGDIVLSTDRSLIIRVGHFISGAGGINHSALVVARPDGSLAVLEAGPFNGLSVEVRDLYELLLKHEERGERVWIRQRKVPLTTAQSEQLTTWAMAQDGKPFAFFRMLSQFSPFRSRGPLRTYYVGGPHGARRSYFCSELVMESCVAVGLVDAETTRPSATYPIDLFMDQSHNRYLNQHQNLLPGWFAPARWKSCP